MKKLIISVFSLGFITFSNAQENIEYQKPSAEILTLADYERPPSVFMDSKREWLIFSYRNTYKTLDELNQDEIRLGGLRINPKTNISSTITYVNNLKIRKINDKTETQVKGLPSNAKITYTSFSPDEKTLAFTNTTTDGVELWVVDLATATAKKISSDYLNANLGMPYTWYKDSQNLLVRTIPKNRATLIDSTKDLPKGPIVSTADGKVSQNRTYQDLLKNPQDEANFDILTQSELQKIALNGTKQIIKTADIFARNSFSPDGNYLMLTTIQKPYSYIVPLNRFPMVTKIYDQNGNLVKTVNEIPLNEIMPKGFSSVRTGKRNMTWRDDKPATLIFAEALDG